MKWSGVILAVIGLGSGYFLGSSLAPGVREEMRTATRPAVAANRAEENDPATVPSTPQIARVATAFPALPPMELSALMREDNSYRRFREIAAYVDLIRPDDLPTVLKQVEDGYGPGRDDLLGVLTGRWVEVDPEDALAAARGRETREVTTDIFDAYYGAWAGRDPAGALAAIQKMPDNGERGDAVSTVLDEIADRAPLETQQLLKSVHASNLDHGNHFIYAQWADQDLDHATEALLQDANFSSRSGGTRSDAINGIADHLFARDPQAATDWLAQLPAGKIHDEAQNRVIDQWASTDPRAAIGWLQELPDSDDKNASVHRVIDAWTTQEPEDALTYAATLPDGSDKTALMQKGAEAWAHADGAAAMKWAQSLPTSSDRKETFLTVIKNWADTDPVAAAASLRSIPQEPLPTPPAPSPLQLPDFDLGMFHGGRSTQFGFNRDTDQETYASVAKAWANNDPAAARAWITQLNNGPCRDAAVESYTDRLLSTAPASAVEMAATIDNRGDRNNALFNLFNKWMATDPDSARAAVQKSSLSDGRKTQLLAPGP